MLRSNGVKVDGMPAFVALAPGENARAGDELCPVAFVSSGFYMRPAVAEALADDIANGTDKCDFFEAGRDEYGMVEEIRMGGAFRAGQPQCQWVYLEVFSNEVADLPRLLRESAAKARRLDEEAAAPSLAHAYSSDNGNHLSQLPPNTAIEARDAGAARQAREEI